MINCTNIMECNYNLTNIINQTAISDPPLWIANLNAELLGYLIIVIVAVFGVLLFLEVRKFDEVSDSEAVAYAGLFTSFIGLLLFVINIVTMPNVKLITWPQLVPILVITSIGIISHFINRRF